MLFLKVTVCHLPHLQVLPGVTVHWSDHARADGRPSARSGLCPRSLSPASRPLVMCVSHDSICWSALDPLVFRGSRRRRDLTPLADNYTWLFLAGAESGRLH